MIILQMAMQRTQVCYENKVATRVINANHNVNTFNYILYKKIRHVIEL